MNVWTAPMLPLKLVPVVTGTKDNYVEDFNKFFHLVYKKQQHSLLRLGFLLQLFAGLLLLFSISVQRRRASSGHCMSAALGVKKAAVAFEQP